MAHIPDELAFLGEPKAVFEPGLMIGATIAVAVAFLLISGTFFFCGLNDRVFLFLGIICLLVSVLLAWRVWYVWRQAVAVFADAFVVITYRRKATECKIFRWEEIIANERRIVEDSEGTREDTYHVQAEDGRSVCFDADDVYGYVALVHTLEAEIKSWRQKHPEESSE